MNRLPLLFKQFAGCLLLLISLQCVARELPPPIDVSKVVMIDSMVHNTWFCIGDRTLAAQDEIAQLPFQTNMPHSFFVKVFAAQVEKPWYLQFQLKNSCDTAIPVCFFPGYYFNSIDLFTVDSAGHLQLLPEHLPSTINDPYGYRVITVAPHSSQLFYARLRFVRTDINALDPRIMRDYYLNIFDRNIKLSLTNNKMYYYIITGILMMMIFYSMAVFLLNRSVEFLYYAAFAFFMGLLFFFKAYYYKTPIPFNYLFESYLDFILLCLGFFFYFIFLDRFLEARRSFPFLHKLFFAGRIIILVSIGLFTWFNFFSDRYSIQNAIENITKYQWFATTVVFIVYAVIHNNKMLNYLAVGHFCLLACSLLSQVLIISPTKLHIGVSIWRDALFCFQAGVTIELIFFLMALAFKNRRDLIERTRERERLRLDNERKEFEKQLAVVAAKQEERNRISADMHDELGSGVTAIRLMSEIVKTKMKGNTLPEIDKISNNANELLSKMNTIIWTMSSSNDRLDNMIAYTRSYASEFFENTNINCHFESPENIPSTGLSGEKRQNIFLCVKESLNNVVKHAKAQDVWIRVTLPEGFLEIEIVDNGVGINLQKLREFGNGLTNMRKRISSIDGIYEISKDSGTRTILKVPI